MNYVRQFSYASMLALACMAHVHANLNGVMQPLTAVADNSFAHPTYQATVDFVQALNDVEYNMLQARAQNTLGDVTAEQIKAAAEEKVNAIKQATLAGENQQKFNAQQIEQYFGGVLASFNEAVDMLAQLPALDQAYGTVREYLNDACGHDQIKQDMSPFEYALKLAQHKAQGGEKAKLQEIRDAFIMAQKVEQILPALHSENTDDLIEDLICPEFNDIAQFTTAKEENKAISNVLRLIEEDDYFTPSAYDVTKAGCLLANCIKQSAFNTCKPALETFIEQFKHLTTKYMFGLESSGSNAKDSLVGKTKSLKKLEAIIADMKVVRAQLLRSARIVLRAAQAKPEAIENFDCADFAQHVTDLTTSLNTLFKQAKELEYAYAQNEQANSWLTLPKISVPSVVSIPSISIAKIPFIGKKPAVVEEVPVEGGSVKKSSWFKPWTWGKKSTEPVVEGGNPQNNNNNIIDYGVFKNVIAELNDLDATQGDKVAALKTLRTQAEAINDLVKAGDYNAEAQRASLVAVVEQIIAKFKQVFVDVNAAKVFMDEKAKGISVRAAVSGIRIALIIQKNIKNVLDNANQDLLNDFSPLLNEIYNAADERVKQA